MGVGAAPTGRPAPLSPAFLRLALHHPPRTCVVAAAPPGGVVGEPAAGRIPSIPPVGALQPARGEFPAPNSPLGPPPVPHGGFLGHWEAQKSVECIRCDFLRSGCGYSMHQTPPGMVRRGGSLGSRSWGRFFSIITGSHCELPAPLA
jgi:hypothetical protein